MLKPSHMLVISTYLFSMFDHLYAAESAEETPPSRESWYWEFDLGFAATRYSGEIADYKEALEKSTTRQSGIDTFGFGFYWPWLPHQAVGFRIEATSEMYKYNSDEDDGDSITLSQSLLAASIAHTFGDADFVGPFVKGDLGFATHAIRSQITIGGKQLHSEESKTGTGLKLTGGYGFLIGEDTRLTLSLGHALAKTGLGTGQVTDFSVGFNF